jgi:nucleoid-associated protein YgaU
MGKDAHMRKDVKLGFAIGGVLLAVLIVYVLVVPGGGDKRLSSATGDAQQTQSGGGAGVSLEPVTPQPATRPSGGGSGATVSVPPAAPPAKFTPPAGGTDPFEQPEAVASKNGKGDLDWSKLLNDSQVLMVTPNKPATPPVTPSSASNETKLADARQSTSSTPVPDVTKPGPTPVTPPAAPPAEPKTVEPPVATPEPAQPNNATANNVTPPPPIVDPPAPGTLDAPPAPEQTTPPTVTANNTTATDAATGQKVHVVAAGETFSTISMIAYGNPNLYAAIMRANPGVDPVKLRPGMKVIVPPASEAKPADAAAPATVRPVSIGTPVSGDAAQNAVSRTEAPIDPQTQYRVQTGDSLYSIAKKLYGRGDRSVKLYEANKQTIGEDMNALKLGTVLTLPEPPTAR